MLNPCQMINVHAILAVCMFAISVCMLWSHALNTYRLIDSHTTQASNVVSCRLYQSFHQNYFLYCSLLPVWLMHFKACLHWWNLLAEMLVTLHCNRTVHIRHQCRKTTVLSCHRCLINTGIEKWTTFKHRFELWSPDVSK